MDLNYYFEPVSLEKTDDLFHEDDLQFGRNIKIHTASQPIDEISNYQIAIIGICEDRNSKNYGSSAAPNIIRSKLYELYRINEKLRIIDLGNLKQSSNVEDTYFGLRDVMIHLLNNQVTAIIIGGTQDISYGAFMAYEQLYAKVNVVSIDARIDMGSGPISASSWNIPVINSKKIFRYTSMGHQQCMVNSEDIKTIEEKGFDVIRLGILRSNMLLSEPFLRDAHLLSFDISSLKQGEAPGTRFSSPNGFMSEEACQLSRYAGLSDLVSCFGIFETNNKYDINDQTSRLAAQAIWYFIEGFSQRKKEKPIQGNKDFKIYMVDHRDMEHTLTFYKSVLTDRWWMEVPDLKNDTKTLVACSHEEYEQACNHDIPDMWWKAFRRIN